MSDKKVRLKNNNASAYNQPDLLVKDISALIDEARNSCCSQYLTELPHQEILEKKLKLAVQIARDNHIKRELIK